MNFFHDERSENSRAFDLADGRVLFHASGRVYYVKDHAHARRLETQLRWTLNLSTLAIVLAILLSYWAGDWRLALLAVPAFLLAVLAERFVVIGCTEATDPAARAEAAGRSTTGAAEGSTLVWPALSAVLLLAAMWLRGKARTPLDAVETTLVVLGLAIGATQVWRHRRIRRERELIGEPRSIDNIPTVPR